MHDLWSECRKHFRRLGFTCKSQQKVLDYITYKFDCFKKDNEQFLLYVVGEDDSFSSVVEAAKVIVSAKAETIIKVVIPSGMTVPAASQKVAADNNIGLSIIDEQTHRITPIREGFTKAQIAKISHDEFRKLLLNINRIAKAKFGIPLFKLDRMIVDAIRPVVQNKDEFISQAAALSSVLELIDKREIRRSEPPSSALEREIFARNQTIKILEFFLRRKRVSYTPNIFRDLQDIKTLRNMPPVHPRGDSLKIARKMLGRIPRIDDDWQELGHIIFSKFQGALILLRNQLRN